MTGKWIGAIFIVLACAAVGFSMAWHQKREERDLQQLLLAVEFMQSELQFRMPPLPELCRMAASHATDTTRSVFDCLASQLDRQLAPEAENCMQLVLQQYPSIPATLAQKFCLLGKSLGRFHLTGQVASLEAVAQMCRKDLDRLRDSQEQRLRSYRTLGICAGLGLAILLM